MTHPLTSRDIELVGKFVGNALNGTSEEELFDPTHQSVLKDGAKLVVQEMLDPFDECLVPGEDLTDEPDV